MDLILLTISVQPGNNYFFSFFVSNLIYQHSAPQRLFLQLSHKNPSISYLYQTSCAPRGLSRAACQVEMAQSQGGGEAIKALKQDESHQRSGKRLAKGTKWQKPSLIKFRNYTNEAKLNINVSQRRVPKNIRKRMVFFQATGHCLTYIQVHIQVVHMHIVHIFSGALIWS